MVLHFNRIMSGILTSLWRGRDASAWGWAVQRLSKSQSRSSCSSHALKCSGASAVGSSPLACTGLNVKMQRWMVLHWRTQHLKAARRHTHCEKEAWSSGVTRCHMVHWLFVFPLLKTKPHALKFKFRNLKNAPTIKAKWGKVDNENMPSVPWSCHCVVSE